MSTRFATAAALCLTLGLSPAIAQQTNPPATTTTTTTTAPPTTTTTAPAGNVTVITAQQPNEMLSENVVGSGVYNMQNERIGDVNNLLIDQSGTVRAVVVGVGGFLGIGERNVAIPFNEVKFMHRDEYDRIVGRASATTTTTAPPATTTTTAPPATTTTARDTAPTDRDLRLVVNATKDQLKNMPAFRG